MNKLKQHRARPVRHLPRLVDPTCPPENALIELLRDARHWCGALGHNYSERDRIANLPYLSEVDVGGQP